ncbi:hypothetical protein Bhyg_01519 [Pseudolycoriella hygida]|uniref:Uncharacterized protein n=1 Tax=Pseudolycoriella hygida TaxID=35572 RepID=A0A9Q0N9P1_9DIPT|nr:hypothetical protein Bhyg_01519 [Pseudolycoriella hygida]
MLLILGTNLETLSSGTVSSCDYRDRITILYYLPSVEQLLESTSTFHITHSEDQMAVDLPLKSVIDHAEVPVVLRVKVL